MAPGNEPTLFERAIRAKQMLEQAFRRSNQRLIQVTQTYREVALAEVNGTGSLHSRVDALAGKLGVELAQIDSAQREYEVKPRSLTPV